METDDRRAPALIFFSIRNLSDFSETEISSLISKQNRGYKRNNIVSVLLVLKKKKKSFSKTLNKILPLWIKSSSFLKTMNRRSSRFLVLKHCIQQEILFLASTFPHESRKHFWSPVSHTSVFCNKVPNKASSSVFKCIYV